MIGTHIAAVTCGMGVFIGAALVLRYPLLRLAMVMASGLGAAWVISATMAHLA